MGDISEMRGLIVIGTFLAVTLLLISLMPSEFYTAGEQRTITPPSYFDSSELINWNFTYAMNISSSYYVDYWGKAEFGHDMLFVASKVGHWLYNKHGYTFPIWGWTGGHSMEWINDEGLSRGLGLTSIMIEEDWDTEKSLASYTVKCIHFWMRTDILYNTSAYSSVNEAWDALDLHVLFGIEWDERGTTWNSWSLISSILFFQPISGVPYIISTMLAVPIWLCVGYMAFIFALRIIGAVFGGGGA